MDNLPKLALFISALSSWLLPSTSPAAARGQPWRDDFSSQPGDTALDQLDTLGKSCSVPACDFAERVTQLAASLSSPLRCLLHTVLRSTLCSSPGRDAEATTTPAAEQVSRPKGWSTAAARQAALAEKKRPPLRWEHDFPVLLLGPRTRYHSSNTCYPRSQASLGKVCLLKPTCCWTEEPSKCHSSSAAIPLAQLSKEQRGVISALGDAEGRCPEQEAPRSRPLRRDTRGNPDESPPLLGRSPTRTHQQPQASDGCEKRVPQGCVTPSSVYSIKWHQGHTSPPTRSQQGPVPPAAVTDLPAHFPTTLEAQRGADHPPAPACPERARDSERGHEHVQSPSQGGCYNGIYTT